MGCSQRVRFNGPLAAMVLLLFMAAPALPQQDSESAPREPIRIARSRPRVADPESPLELARNGRPKKPFYMTGQLGGRSFSVHAEGERMVLRRDDGEREEITLTSPQSSKEPAPGSSPLDDGLKKLAESTARTKEASHEQSNEN